MAEVKLNGRDLGILWKPPFRVDVTDALQPGPNNSKFKVVNLWINRLIGDEQLPEDSDRNANGTLKQWPHGFKQARPAPPAASLLPRGGSGRKPTRSFPPDCSGPSGSSRLIP